MAEKRTPKPKAEWKGHRPEHRRYEFLNGVPARDLSDDDYAALSDEQQADVAASGLYNVRADPEPDKPAGKADTKEG